MEFTKANYKSLKRPGVYRIFNKTTGKNYVGSSLNLYNRMREQRNLLKTGKNHNPKLQFDFDLYGVEDFVFEAIALCEAADRYEFEAEWIGRLVAVELGYNFSADPTKPRLGVKTSPATLSKMSAAQKIEMNRPERKAISAGTLAAYNSSKKGKSLPPAHRKAISAAHKQRRANAVQ